METKSYLLPVAAICVILSASMSSCEIPTFWEEEEEWTGTYVRVNLTQKNETMGLFQWYPEYQLGVSYQHYKDGNMIASDNNRNYIIEDHIKSHNYDNERCVYYGGNWSEQMPLPNEQGEYFNYAFYAPYTNACSADFVSEQSELSVTHSTDMHQGKIHYRQGSELSEPYDLLWANLLNVDKDNLKEHISTGPLFFAAEHALAKILFSVTELESRYELKSILVCPSDDSKDVTAGYFDVFSGKWEAEDDANEPEWNWVGSHITRSETSGSTEYSPIYLLPSYATANGKTGLDIVISLENHGEERLVEAHWCGTLIQNKVHCISINKSTAQVKMSICNY